MRAWRSAVIGLAGLAAACTTTAPSGPTTPPARRPPAEAPAAPQPSFQLAVLAFSDLPGWDRADLAPALAAFQRQCEAWSRLPAEQPVARAGAPYGGLVGEWRPACLAAAQLAPANARWLFESYFTPHRVAGPGQAKLTSYYEPAIEARRQPEPGFTEPLLPRPADMVSVDLRAFAERLDSEALRGAPRSLTGQIVGGRIAPYPERAQIVRTPPAPPIAYAHPADVYNLQVQGSGRLIFPDGAQVRAAYAAQNGFSWRSAIQGVRDRLPPHPNGVWASLRAYLDANPAEARSVLDHDPSYVFFAEETVADPAAGPRGAAGVALTPGGSLAVDPAWHPYGVPIFVAIPEHSWFPRLLVAQDTGGAIRRGPLRGDFFAGSGAEAGRLAVSLNVDNPGFFVLLPRPAQVAEGKPGGRAG